MHRSKVAELLRQAAAPGISPASSITCASPLRAAASAALEALAHLSTAEPRRDWAPHPLRRSLVSLSSLATPPPPPAIRRHLGLHERRGYAAAAPGGGGSSPAEELDLIAPDLGLIRIDGYDDSGFILGDVQTEGAVLVCEDLWLQWTAVTSLDDVTLPSLALLDLIKPAPDLLVLGCGRRIGKVPADVAEGLRARGVTVEALDTVNAVATYNILSQEGRKVVGALLPADVE